jgi:hypothetical protein
MVSILGRWNYKFPQPIPLTKTMADYLEDEVDEKYYINSEKAQNLIKQLIDSGILPNENGYYNISADCSPKVYTAFFMNGDFYYWMSQTKIDNVIAWQPLPEPYKQEVSE